MKVFSPDEIGCLHVVQLHHWKAKLSLTAWHMLLKNQDFFSSCNNLIKFTLENLSAWELEFCVYKRLDVVTLRKFSSSILDSLQTLTLYWYVYELS